MVSLLLFLFFWLFRCVRLLREIRSGSFLLFFGRFWLWRIRARTLIAISRLARRSITRLSTVARRWVSTASSPCLLSFTARHRASAVLTPRRKSTIYNWTRLYVAYFFLSRLTLAVFPPEHRWWVIAIPRSNPLSSATRFIAFSKCRPLAEPSVNRTDF